MKKYQDDDLLFWYTNHRGIKSLRRVSIPKLWYGTTKWHTEPQWFINAFDIDKQDVRDFACDHMESWSTKYPTTLVEYIIKRIDDMNISIGAKYRIIDFLKSLPTGVPSPIGKQPTALVPSLSSGHPPTAAVAELLSPSKPFQARDSDDDRQSEAPAAVDHPDAV